LSKRRFLSGLGLLLALILMMPSGGSLAADQAASPGWAKDIQAGSGQKPARNPAWAVPLNLPEADNLYRVSPGLYRSAQPSAAAFREYEKLGIKTVINLRARHSDRQLITGTGLKLIEVPINTWAIDDEDIIRVLGHIKNEAGPVLVHCQHGADRTGTVMAMYRIIFEGWSKEAALDELRNGGYGYHAVWRNIPKYIRNADVKRLKAAL